ncbi:MAG TPA: penicillin-binding transpeptidase domain-containing protein [Flexilinea sp.]|jgi:penicillin-binding protein 2|nr:penicillin-binding transpeptidase domain-containing protein [Flexilinea sp.]HQP45900.1 penicillin-binding transpeptidase domain-containing protein [Flexilinea sp.]
MKRFIICFIFLCVFTAGCGPKVSDESTKTPEITTVMPSDTPLPEPVVMITSAPEARTTANTFLEFWKADDFVSMYNMLSQVSRDAIPFEDFETKYKEAETNLTLQSLNCEVTSALTNPKTAQIGYHATYQTALAGTFSRDMVMNLVFEANDWKIQWDDGMIMPELSGGNKIEIDIDVPTRGPIYDIDGVPLAAETEAYAIGVVPASVPSNRWNGLINELSRLTGKTTFVITQLMEEANQYDYVVIGEVPAAVVEERMEAISSYEGVYLNSYTASRFYYEGGSAPHLVGYVQPIGEDEAETMKRQGYRIDERIGRIGIEKWGQDRLDGERGASVYVVDSAGNPITRLYKSDPVPAETIYTTFKEDFQYDLQRAIAGFRGAIVVLERDTGRVLGMASSPTFDPNLLDFNNYNSFYSANLLYNDDRPMYNRATQGQYPLGSVFKIITMSAALESGVYHVNDTYDCGYEFTELPGITLTDWTLDHDVAASGKLTLSEGLMRSCNPWFYKIGLELFRQKGADYLPSMARGFGLGSPTGIGEVEEESGNVETPPDEYSSVQMGIGQGTLLVTPLQVARFVAAVGNGGTLYRPQVVEQIVDYEGNVTYAFKPEEQGKLPVSKENLELVQQAMLSVTNNPRGTAYSTFKYIKYPVYGKTGTAQTSPGEDPHAWFAGYTDRKLEGKPDIAVAVLVENMGDGSVYAAPIFRRVLELYFDGKASMLYNWEAGVYITKTPTPTPTITPTPEPTKAPWQITPEVTP